LIHGLVEKFLAYLPAETSGKPAASPKRPKETVKGFRICGRDGHVEQKRSARSFFLGKLQDVLDMFCKTTFVEKMLAQREF